MAPSALALLQRRLTRDRIVRASSPFVRLALVHAPRVANEARLRSGVADARAARLLGDVAASAALLSAFLEGEERASVRFNASSAPSSPPISVLRAEATAAGEVCASAAGTLSSAARVSAHLGPVIHAGWEVIDTEEGESAAAAAWDGRLAPTSAMTVSRVLYRHTAPVSSTVAADAGDVRGSLAHFLEASDQGGGAALALETRAGASGIDFCGGVLALHVASGGGRPLEPGAALHWTGFSEVAARVERLQLARLHAQGVTLEAMARSLLRVDGVAEIAAEAAAAGPEPEARAAAAIATEAALGIKSVPLDFFCRCTKARFVASAARVGGPALLRGLIAEHETKGTASKRLVESGAVRVRDVVTTLVCAHCQKRYYITSAEAEAAAAAEKARAAAEEAEPSAS